MQDFAGVASGSFSAPDHEYPSYLELRLTATDSSALTGVASVNLDPRTVPLGFETNPAGLSLSVNLDADPRALLAHGDRGREQFRLGAGDPDPGRPNLHVPFLVRRGSGRSPDRRACQPRELSGPNTSPPTGSSP